MLLEGLWIYVILLLVTAVVIWVFAKASSSITAHKYKEEAKQLLESGNWQTAAILYKKAIMESLVNPTAFQELTNDLTEIYRKQGIKADLSEVLQGPRLFREILHTQVPTKEKGRLIANLNRDMAKILNKYPGEMDS